MKWPLIAGGLLLAGIIMIKQKNKSSTAAVTSTSPAPTTSAPRGIRNNNPGNIRENQRVDYDWVGESLVDSDLDFEEFSMPVYGIRAIARILKTYRTKYGINTIAGIISKWAPPTGDSGEFENDTQSYINSVSKRVGLLPNAPVDDLHIPDIIDAIIYHENGQQPYTTAMIYQGVALA